jgi:DNA modification methylase
VSIELNKIYLEDCLETMARIPENSIDFVLTSPPYFNARDYSQYPTYSNYLDFMTKVLTSLHKVTKEGRFLTLNTSPVIVPRAKRSDSSKRLPIPYDLHSIAVGIGWEFIDDIVWLKPEASVKNRVGSFSYHRRPLGYKPNCVTEMLMIYRKKTDKLIDWNLKQYSKEIIQKSLVADGFESSNVWKISPSSSKNHSAIFPDELADKAILYYSLVGDVVYDPFMGSGTTAAMAKINGRNFIGSEITKKYAYLANERLKKIGYTK